MKTSIENKVIETKVARLSMDENDIVHMTIDYRHVLSVDDIKELRSAVGKISGGLKAAVFVKRADIIGYKGISRDARAYAAGEEAIKVFKSVAILVTNPVIRMAANFFIKLNKPPFAVRLFTSEERALVWLRRFRA